MNRLKRVHFAATGRELHIDVPLSNVAIDYQPQDMIAETLAPVVTVPNISGQIPVFGRRDKLRTEDDLRAPGSAAKIVHREVSSDSFFCKGRALAHWVPIEDRANADPIYVQKLFNGAAEFLRGKLMLNAEVRIANQVTSGSNVGSYSAVSSSWSDNTNSNPISDVNQMLDNVQDSTGVRPNKVAFGDLAWRHFRRNDNVRNLIFGNNNGGGYASRAQVADLLDVEEIMVGGAYEDTANEAQAENLQQVWGNNVLAYYAPDAPSIYVPSFMYSFRWAAAGIPNMQVERHPYDTVHKAELVELGYYQDEVITGAEYGFLLIAVDSST